jgi:hypothetical protein
MLLVMRVKLLKHTEDLFGTIKCLHLKAKLPYRPNDLYRVLWDNGKIGIVELKDVVEI